MINEVRVALSAVRARGVPEVGDLSVVEMEGVRGVHLGIDDLRRPHLLLRLGPSEAPPPASDVAALEVGARTLILGGETHRFLDVACLFESVADVFEHFVAAVADRVRARPGEATGALIEVLEKWRQFLVPSKAVSRGKLVAAFGELLVLRDIVQADATKRVDSWVGPFGGRHDFRRGPVALEVKTTRAHTSRDVTIHGEDQLAIPESGSLHLHFVRIEEVPNGGETVASIVDDLLSAGAVTDRLFEGLTATGIPLPELAGTGDISFQVRERFTFPIDEQTPRIVSDSFVGGMIPIGVLDLSYVISIDHFLDRAVDEATYGRLIRDLSGGA